MCVSVRPSVCPSTSSLILSRLEYVWVVSRGFYARLTRMPFLPHLLLRLQTPSLLLTFLPQFRCSATEANEEGNKEEESETALGSEH